MAEWTSDEKEDYAIRNMNRNQRRKFKKLIEKGWTTTNALFEVGAY